MAVHIHHPPNAITQNFRTLIQPIEAGCKSDMTSIAPPSSQKRAREVDISSRIMHSQQNLGFECQFQQPKVVCSPANGATVNCPFSPQNHFRQPNLLVSTPANMTVVNGGLPCVSPLESRLFKSAGASNTGQSVFSQDNEDINTIVRLHTEQIRLGLEAMKRQCTSLLWGAQQQAVKRLRENEVQIAKVNQRNAELEKKVRQLAVERQMWFNISKKKEADMRSLRATIQQFVDARVAPADEGFGESKGVLGPGVDDAQSCCVGEDEKVRRWNLCRSCGEGEMCVLLLPCRHLCLCMDCESRIDKCPVCNSAKKACLRVVMP